MDRVLKYALILAVISIFLASTSLGITSTFDACGYVDKIVDGDTIWMTFTELNGSKFKDLDLGRYKIRFADINAPEIDTPEGVSSRNFLVSLIDKYGDRVCLDIDDKYVTDRYGRIVAMVYLINGSEALNINKYMVVMGYAEAKDYRNEFSLDETPLKVALDNDGMDDNVVETDYIESIIKDPIKLGVVIIVGILIIIVWSVTSRNRM